MFAGDSKSLVSSTKFYLIFLYLVKCLFFNYKLMVLITKLLYHLCALLHGILSLCLLILPLLLQYRSLNLLSPMFIVLFRFWSKQSSEWSRFWLWKLVFMILEYLHQIILNIFFYFFLCYFSSFACLSLQIYKSHFLPTIHRIWVNFYVAFY